MVSTTYFAVLLALPVVVAGLDASCGKGLQCSLVNLDVSSPNNVFNPEGTALGTTNFVYNPKDSNSGWSINCEIAGKIEYVKYFYGEGSVNTQYSVPFWANGDNNGQIVNTFPHLMECGEKEITVKFYSWEGGDEFPCSTSRYSFTAKCDRYPPAPTPPMPVTPPMPLPVSPVPIPVPVPSPILSCFDCPANSVPNMPCPGDFGSCICNNGFLKTGNQCVKVFQCPANSVPVSLTPTSFVDCNCNDGYLKSSNECVKLFTCPWSSSPTVPIPTSFDQCTCNDGYFKKDDRCILQCPENSSPNVPFPTVFQDHCNCDKWFIQTDNECVKSNPIKVENLRSGTTAWFNLKTADDKSLQIKGYSDQTSYAHGETINFRVTVSPVQSYVIDIFRLGYYGGTGARLLQQVGPLSGITQPTCPLDVTTGMVSCNWSVSHSLTIPTTWTTGVYLAKLTNDNGFQNYINFVVRDDVRTGDFLYQQSVSTYHAYNNFPADGTTGKSLYGYNSYGPTTVSGSVTAVKVSLDRPFSGGGSGQIFGWEHDLIQWLEMMGYDINYSTNWDTHLDGARLQEFEGFLSTGHDEYWTMEMYDSIVGARDNGVDIAFFGANVGYWQVRLEPSASGATDRVMVCYKDASIDPTPHPHLETVKWRDVNRPEQTLVGVQYGAWGNTGNTNYIVQNSDHWLYSGTGLVNNEAIPGIVGYEVDNYDPTFAKPAHLSYTVLGDSQFIPISGIPLQSKAVIYQATSGAWVFGAGTMSWSWALNKSGKTNQGIQQTTENLLTRFLAPSDYAPPPAGLVASWQFDEDSWSGAAGKVIDSGGQNLHGTAVNGVTTTDREPAIPGEPGTCRYAYFNGIDQSVRLDYHSVQNPKDFTVSLWARVDNGNGSWRAPITSRWAYKGRRGFNIYAGNDDRWQFWTGDGRQSWDVLTGPPVIEGAWTHVAVSFEASSTLYERHFGTKTIYLNGVNVAQSTGYYQANHDNALHLGAGWAYGNTSYFFNGAIDEVRLFNTALNESEISEIADEVHPCF